MSKMNAKSLALVLSLFHIASAWWDDRCAEGGQCANMIKNYQELIQGEGCRSFYITGKCSRICTFSLKSLVRRHTWSKCAERCEWQKSTTDGAQSWLSMCLARPAPDVHQDASDPITDRVTMKQDSNMSSSSMEEAPDGKGVFKSIRTFVFSGAALMLCFLLLRHPSFRVWLSSMFRTLTGRLRQLWKPSVKTPSGKGPLDGLPSRNELRVLQRGARRHLKAFRSNLD